jgi:hypothetical protein
VPEPREEASRPGGPGGLDDAAAKLDRYLELADTRARLAALDG